MLCINNQISASSICEQVPFYFSLPVHTYNNILVQFLLALVTSISGIEQGDLSKIDHRKKTQITVIKIDDIIGLVGLVKRKKETYVVYKKKMWT